MNKELQKLTKHLLVSNKTTDRQIHNWLYKFYFVSITVLRAGHLNNVLDKTVVVHCEPSNKNLYSST